MSHVAVIVPTFNGAGVISRFLETHKRHTPSDVLLIVVDNNSQDDTVEIVERLAPESTIIRNSENTGFATACNQGMRSAIERGVDFVFLANQDLSFTDAWLEPLVKKMAKEPRAGAVQSFILLYPQTDRINSCGNSLHYLGFGFTKGYQQKLSEWRRFYSQEIGYCSGAAVLYRVKALEEVGLFDEAYFMYHEDTDLSWRLLLAGYSLAVEPSSRVNHEYEFSRSIQKFYYIERNRIYTMLKNYQFKTLLLIAPLFFIWEFGLFCYSLLGLISGKKTLGCKEKLRGYAFFCNLKNIKTLLASRRAIQSKRKVADRALVKHWVSVIEFQDVKSPLLEKCANPVTDWYWKCIQRYV